MQPDEEVMSAAANSARGKVNRRIAIVVVHGVNAHPRYEIQDKVADALAANLNDDPGNIGDERQRWRVDIEYPRVEPGSAGMPTITRVSRALDSTIFDVIEAYWSPISKNRATVIGVLSWLLRVVFVPVNSTARLQARPTKVLFDVCYVGGAIILAIASIVAGMWLALQAVSVVFVKAGVLSFGGLVPAMLRIGPIAVAVAPVYKPLAVLATSAVGGFLAIQALKAIINACHQAAVLQASRGWRARLIGISIIVICSGTLLLVAGTTPLLAGTSLGITTLLFVVCAGFFEFARKLLASFLVNFFGDIQVYTSRDENGSFFELRAAILNSVQSTLMTAVAEKPFGALVAYDRVIVMAHSLGSTVALDALMRLYELTREGGLAEDCWHRVRAFVTFGSALEKTRFFFDALHPSTSASFQQWRDDAYGPIFTADTQRLREVAGSPIVWHNYWYHDDPVANEIATYRSISLQNDQLSSSQLGVQAQRDVDYAARATNKIGIPRLICRNFRGNRTAGPLHLLVHGDYLADPWFWKSDNDHIGILEILLHCDQDVVHLAAPEGHERVDLVDPRSWEARSARRRFLPDRGSRH